MAHPEFNTNFTNSQNYGLQVGNNSGNIQYASMERPESPPKPHVVIEFPRDQDYVDRKVVIDDTGERQEEVMEILHQRLAIPGSITALVGLGGVGKSQLGIEYAYQAYDRSCETLVFWAHASNAARLKLSYEQIAETVKISGRRNPNANTFQLVNNWLRDPKNGKLVLILDNLDNADFLLTPQGHDGSPLKEYLGRSQNGSILITSRSKEAALKLVEHRDIISINEMSVEEARELLEKKLPDQTPCESIVKLATALDCIPLAIIQAAAYISDPDRQCSVRRYLKMFQESDRKRTSLLNHKEGQFRRDWDASDCILTTWQISFDSLRQTRRSASDLLSLMSLFDKAGIPKTLLEYRITRENSEQNGDSDDDSKSQSTAIYELEDDIYTLKRYSFISASKDQKSFRMHRLVQLAMRNWLAFNNELQEWNQQCIQILNSEFPSGHHGTLDECEVLFRM